jgi:hypothetical protein
MSPAPTRTLALWDWTVTAFVRVTVSEPEEFVARNDTVYVPAQA